MLELHLVLLLRQSLELLVALLQTVKRGQSLGFIDFFVLMILRDSLVGRELERVGLLVLLRLLVITAMTAQLFRLIHNARVVFLNLMDLWLNSILELVCLQQLLLILSGIALLAPLNLRLSFEFPQV